MPAIHSRLVQRTTDDDTSAAKNFNMTLGVVGLLFFALCMCASLWILRRARLRKQAILASSGGPQVAGVTPPAYTQAPANNTITIQATDNNGRSSVLYIGSTPKPMLANPDSPPHSPDNVPEIRLTFPDELDEAGRNQSGRVLVVRVSESGVGLEPVAEQPPAYEKESKTQFVSIDMDQIGGLKEKETRP